MLAGDAGAALAGANECGSVVTNATHTQNDVVVFVDAGASDLAAVQKPVADGAELVLLHGDRDGVQQIREHLAGRSGIREIHLVSHGTAGEFQLGSKRLNAETMKSASDDLRSWGDALENGADILVYGCDVAGNAAGESLVRGLAALTGADVAASVDRTGNVSQQGDWDLEYQVGRIDTGLALSNEAIRRYQGHLGIEIRAAGSVGDEQFKVDLGDQTLSIQTVVNNDLFGGNFQSYFVDYDGANINDLRISFINDAFDASSGFDRNLGIDWVRIDGVQYETESPNVYSSGVWDGNAITKGFQQTEILYANGFFDYGANTNDESGANRIDIVARGATGDETMQLVIDGNVVQTYTNVSQSPTTYSFNTDQFVTADQVRVQFINSVYRPDVGYDQDLIVDAIQINGQRFETESPSTFSTGTYVEGQGIVSGNVQSETLNSDGYFQYSSSGNPNQSTQIEIFARGSTGDESMQLLVDGNVIQTYTSVSQNQSTYSFNIDRTVTADQIRVQFINAFYVPEVGYDQNLIVDAIQLNGQRYESESPSTFSTGTFVDGQGIVPGNLQSETLHSDGYFQYSSQGVTPVDPPSTQAGQIGFAETQVTVNENEGTVSIGLRRTNGTSGTARVFYQTQDGSAESGSDYLGSESSSVTFADGQDFATIEIPLIDNGDDDGEKSFGVSLFRVDGANQGEPRTAQVTIVDDESGSGLIGYWNLNEGSAGTVNDSSGLGNNGQAISFANGTGPTSDRPDTRFSNSGAFSFNNGADYIDVGPNESLRLTEGTYSQAAWIKPTSTDDLYHGVIGYQAGNSVGTRYPFVYVRNDAIYAGFGTGGNTWKGVVADGVITIGTWNHVAVSFDGTTMQLFVNGEIVGTNSSFGGSLPPTDFAQLNIGRINNQFIGQIDEVRMYDRAISGAEVAGLISGATLPPPRVVGFFTTEVVAGGFVQPTTIERLPDGRFLVAERAGIIKVTDTNGNTQVLLDIRERVNTVGPDRGIMSIAIPPNFAQTRQLYVAYTYDPPEVQGRAGDGGPDGEGARVARVGRFTLNESFTVADPNSEVVVLGKNSTYENIGQPNRRPLLNDPQSGIDENGQYIEDFIASSELSHTIGDMEFAADGSLFVSTGDGGSYGRVDPVNLRALDINSLNGKILRIDPNTGQGLSDNPFYNGNPNSNASRVYSYGLRNPFRFALDPNSGEVFIADVGWLNYEEVNTGRGKNFGWPAYEGIGLTGGDRGSYTSLQQTRDFLAQNPEITPPIWLSSHANGARAIIMGDFIQGGDYPASLQGAFLFSDIGDQIIRAGRLDANGNLIDVIPVSSRSGFITDMMRMPDGSLWYTDLVSGTIGKLNFNV